MSPPSGREVTLVLCTTDGEVLGALPPLPVEVEWWPEAWPVVEAARAAYGVEVAVLRLLRTEAGRGAGGRVAYLAQVHEAPALRLRPWDGDPSAHEPLRQPWACPGGPDADLAWAEEVLAGSGTPRTGPARQVKTWNLSSIWALPTTRGRVWLKHVPPFLAHEGVLLARLSPLDPDPAAVPPLLAVDGGRVLLGDVAGEDQYEAPLQVQLRMVGLLVALQARWAGALPELLGDGLPDWRAEAFGEPAYDVLLRTRRELEAPVLRVLEGLVDGLRARFAGLASCGLPDTLVHGDFHRGNFRATSYGEDGEPAPLVLLDWGDSGVGSPLLDQAAFLDRLPTRDRPAVREEWSRLWRRVVPGSDPDRATRLLAPVAALRQAVVYRRFLDGIEPDERVYHAGDPADWLRRAAAAVAAGARGA